MRNVALVSAAVVLFVACSSDSTDTTSSASGASSSISSSATAASGGGGGNGGSTGGAGTTGGAGGAGGGPNCTPDNCNQPGSVCVDDICVDDCRLPGANPCLPPTVCDYGSDSPGQCVDPSVDDCVITGEPVPCGSNLCGPGTLCDASSSVCYAEPPCGERKCEGNLCWGEACECNRPPATCAPAPLGNPGDAGTLNDFVFSRCGTLSSCNGGIFDLDFDQSCNAFGVTMISGTDYLRRIDPAGNITEVDGVTNLNMGEVATAQGESGTFGGNQLEDTVALAYICCATCGCIIGPGGNPQGVARWDVPSNTLPMEIPSSTFTSGNGPFGNALLDTGPYGLSWGLERVLYVGNTDANGQYHALNLTTLSKQLLHTFSNRVLASAPFDQLRMLVGLEGGEVYLIPVQGKPGSPELLITLPDHPTSMQRDPWSGRVYAELSSQAIVSFDGDGGDLKTFQMAPAKGRMSLAPDGYLYHLTSGWPTQAAIVRWPLPTKWGE